MAAIPQFESSVPIQPAPIVSSAPVWDELGRLTNKITGEVGSEIQREGRVALEANRYEGAAQIAHQSTNAYIEASKNPDVAKGMEEFQHSMNGIASGVLSHAPEQNVPYLKRMLVYHTDRYNLSFARREAQQSKSLAYNKFASTYDTLINQMSNAGYNGDQHSALVFHGQVKNMIDDGVKNGFLDASRAALFTKNLQNELYQGVTLGQYRAARSQGLDQSKQFKKQFMQGNKYNKWFDVGAKEQMLNQFSRIDKEFANENGINSATYNLYAKQLVFEGQNGRKLDNARLGDMISAFPKKAPTLLNNIRNAQQQYQIVSGTKNGSLVDIQSKINELQDPNNIPANVNDAQNNLKAAIQLKDYQKDLIADPVRIISQSPAYKEKLQEIKAKGNLTPTQLNIEYQKQLGFKQEQIHALDNNTASQAVESIKGMPLQEQVQAFDNFVGQHAASSRPFIIKDLQKAGLPLSSQYLYRISTSDDPTLQNMTTSAAIAWSHIQIINGVSNYAKALGDYSAILKPQGITTQLLYQAVTSDSTFSQYANIFMSQGGDTARALSNYTNHGTLLTAQLISQGESLDTAASNANKAMTAGLAFNSYRGNEVGYDSTINSSVLFGHRFLGKSYSPGVLDYLLANAQKEGVDIPKGFKQTFPKLTPKALQEKYLSGSSFVTLPDQSGLILQDQNQLPVKADKDKSNIVVRWEDLKDHNSQLMEDFTKKKSEWGFIKKDLSKLNPQHLGFLDATELAKEILE